MEAACYARIGGATPCGKSKDRRASILIAETAEVLHGLREDADRGEGLIAELESLLASSRAASRKAATPPAPHCNTIDDLLVTAQHTNVQPLHVDVTDNRGDGESEEVYAPPDASGTKRAAVEKRRSSSIIHMDGSFLFAGGGASPAPGQGTASVSGQGPFAAAAGTAALASRAPSTRGRGCLQGGSWTEGRPGLAAGAGGLSMRARGAEGVGGAAQAAAAVQPALLAVSGSGGSFSGKGSAARRCPSVAADEPELVGRLPSGTTGTTGARRPPRRTATLPAGCLLPKPSLLGNQPSDTAPRNSCQGDGDAYGAEGLPGGWHPLASPAASAGGANGAGGAVGEQAGSRTPRARSGRFMNVLKGMFNAHGQQPGDPRSACGDHPASSANRTPEPQLQPQPKSDQLRSSSFHAYVRWSATPAAGVTAAPAMALAVSMRSLSMAQVHLGTQGRGSGAAAVPDAPQPAADGKAALSRRASSSSRVLACSLPQI